MKILLILLLSITTIGCYNCKDVFDQIRKEQWAYHVDRVFISSNHATHTLVVSNTSQHQVEIGVDELKDLYNNASIGDSLYKAAGSLEFKLIKKDTVMSFYPMCDGETVK